MSDPNDQTVPADPPDPEHESFSAEVGPERELKVSDVQSEEQSSKPRPRQVRTPVVLFLATCASTFWVGAASWRPMEALVDWPTVFATIGGNWRQGLSYMFAVLAILLTHEMGHFLFTVLHRIPASYPLCIPVPFIPLGTMGALIGMEGMRANRKEIFDIGLAGPLAGLAVAVPVLWYGVGQLDLTHEAAPGDVLLNSPICVRWMIEAQHADVLRVVGAHRADWIGLGQVNPYFMAGWVGMLVTGLNMLPISQLDGGHTIYGLFGSDAKTLARGFLVVAITYVVINLEQAAVWTPMLILVILMGVDHPPTSDDDVELDQRRWLLGAASLAIPVLCFPLLGLRQ